MTHPAEVRHVVSSTIVPGRYRRPAGTIASSGPSRNPPAALSSSAPNTLGASGLGRHSHSTFPLGATSALASRSERKANSSIAGKGLPRSREWYPGVALGGCRGDVTLSPPTTSPHGSGSVDGSIVVPSSAVLDGGPRRSSGEDSIPRIGVLGVEPGLLLAGVLEVEDADHARLDVDTVALRANVVEGADVLVVTKHAILPEPESGAGDLPPPLSQGLGAADVSGKRVVARRVPDHVIGDEGVPDRLEVSGLERARGTTVRHEPEGRTPQGASVSRRADRPGRGKAWEAVRSITSARSAPRMATAIPPRNPQRNPWVRATGADTE